jgi:hypothetical protein
MAVVIDALAKRSFSPHIGRSGMLGTAYTENRFLFLNDGG